jgi:hypothetical protein
MLIVTKKDSRMRKLPQPWNLRRSFDSQPVVCVGRSTCPKAGIPARMIPAIPSRSTLHGLGDVFWRLGDLATRVLDSSHSSSVFTAFNSKVGDLAAIVSSRPRPPFQGKTIVRTSSPVLPRGTIFFNSIFPSENSEELSYRSQFIFDFC